MVDVIGVWKMLEKRDLVWMTQAFTAFHRVELGGLLVTA